MELHQNSTNSPNDINLKIDSIIDMTLRKIIPWTTLATLLNEMTPTLESSKQVIKVLLHTLESLSNKQQSRDIQEPMPEKPEIQTSSEENMIEQNEHQNQEDLEISERNRETASKNLTLEKSLTEQEKENNIENDSQDRNMDLKDQSNDVSALSSLNQNERIHIRAFSMQGMWKRV